MGALINALVLIREGLLGRGADPVLVRAVSALCPDFYSLGHAIVAAAESVPGVEVPRIIAERQWLYRQGCHIGTVTETEIAAESENHPDGSAERQNIERILNLEIGESVVLPNSGVRWTRAPNDPSRPEVIAAFLKSLDSPRGRRR